MFQRWLVKAHTYYRHWLEWRYPLGWHSFDRKPWQHPWLTPRNLSALREFSKKIREEAACVAAEVVSTKMRFAFVGNLANSSYQRIRALQEIHVSASLFLHPGDDYPMSQPEWEEYDGVLPEGIGSIEQLKATGVDLPPIADVYKIPPTNVDLANLPKFGRVCDFIRWPQYFGFLPLLRELNRFSALYTVQVPYLAYLSGRPYVATHMGGDIWFDCSRGDELGSLQRQAFLKASAITVSNPWSPAFARRYGLKNMITLPMILDPKAYCPGEPTWREDWISRVGGNFFVLSTARLDDHYKGSNLALEGFARFAKVRPGARLILLGWGSDLSKHKDKLMAMGIANRVLFLPPSGKKRLIQYLRSADCLLDQFVIGYFGLTALEAMSVGLPVIMRLEAKQYDDFLDAGSPPVLNANTIDEVAEALDRLAASFEFRNDIVGKTLNWFQQGASPHVWAKSYLDLLIATAAGHKFDYRDSPLGAPLSREEREYHLQELNMAPRFPSYH
jgi:glycosyltransferase involved in cell wall biosynthesis